MSNSLIGARIPSSAAEAVSMDRSRLRLIDSVAGDPDRPWKDNARDQFAIDANAVLEALLAEYGVEAALAAVERQGLKGAYRHVIEPLHAEAVARRLKRQAAGGTPDAEPGAAPDPAGM
jgi:hypothetical protein